MFFSYFFNTQHQPRDWLNGKNLEFRVCDYSLDSLTASLADVDILYSLMHDNSEFFKLAHFNMLEACKRSPKCKRFVPSECGGDIEEFPQHPEFYVPTHVPVREALQAQHGVDSFQHRVVYGLLPTPGLHLHDKFGQRVALGCGAKNNKGAWHRQ